MGKQHNFLDPDRRPEKIEIEIELSNSDFDSGWKTQLGQMLIEIGLSIRDDGKTSEIIHDTNGNNIGRITEH